jgi:hypothetical protein
MRKNLRWEWSCNTETMEKASSRDLWMFGLLYLSEEGIFEIRYRAMPKNDTVINLTNHAYFNPRGTFGRLCFRPAPAA